MQACVLLLFLAVGNPNEIELCSQSTFKLNLCCPIKEKCYVALQSRYFLLCQQLDANSFLCLSLASVDLWIMYSMYLFKLINCGKVDWLMCEGGIWWASIKTKWASLQAVFSVFLSCVYLHVDITWLASKCHMTPFKCQHVQALNTECYMETVKITTKKLKAPVFYTNNMYSAVKTSTRRICN